MPLPGQRIHGLYRTATALDAHSLRHFVAPRNLVVGRSAPQETGRICWGFPALELALALRSTPTVPHMLRITSSRTETTDTLKVEGRLAGEWVEELSKATAAAAEEAARVVLDLGEVTFAWTPTESRCFVLCAAGVWR